MPITRLENVQNLKPGVLNKTTFEREYTKKYIDTRGAWSFGRCIAKAWLALFKTWGCENVHGYKTHKDELELIKNYHTALAEMIGHASRIVDPEIAKCVGVGAEKVDKVVRVRIIGQLKDASATFHRSLRKRIMQLKDVAHKAGKAFEYDEAELYQAGLLDISGKIKENNGHFLRKHFVREELDHALDSIYLAQNSIDAIADQITLDDILDKGPDAIAEALKLHCKTFGKTPEPQKLRQYIAEIRRKLTQRLGTECEKRMTYIRSNEFLELRVKELTTPLTQANVQNKVRKEIRQLYSNLEWLTQNSVIPDQALFAYIFKQLNIGQFVLPATTLAPRNYNKIPVIDHRAFDRRDLISEFVDVSLNN